MKDEAEELLKGRVAFFNVWKPFCEKVEELPLAMCDVRTSTDADFPTMKLNYRERTGEIFVLRHSPKHEWYYFPWMESKHAILLKTYDSETDGRARFTGHSAFEDPNSPASPQLRESIEIRTIAFFKANFASRPSHYLDKKLDCLLTLADSGIEKPSSLVLTVFRCRSLVIYKPFY